MTILIFVLTFVIPVLIFAHGNETTTQNNNDHTAREEAEGRELWGKMQAKEVNCENLSDENFGALGEYFMGQMAGKQHEAMNNMMTQMIGEEGEEQMHIVMGKRMSGCEPLAPMPQSVMDSDTMPMMNMMMGNMCDGKLWRLGMVRLDFYDFVLGSNRGGNYCFNKMAD